MQEDRCLRKAEALMAAVVTATDLPERRRLIEQAMQWHNRAIQARNQRAAA